MKYKCVGNIDKFWFRDAEVEKIEAAGDCVEMTAAGIVARYNNPSNDTLVDRYMDTALVRFKNAAITRMYLEGAKYYSADDVLLKQIPDTEIAPEDYDSVLKQCKGAYLFAVKMMPADENGICHCEFAVDIEDPEDKEAISTYWMELAFEKTIIEWDRFLNKAMLDV